MQLHDSTEGRDCAVIEVDQRKLVQNYKVVPFHDGNYADERVAGKSGSEEVVLHDHIRPLSAVMTRFWVNQVEIERILQPETLEKYFDSKFFNSSIEEVTKMAQFVMNHPKRVT